VVRVGRWQAASTLVVAAGTGGLVLGVAGTAAALLTARVAGSFLSLESPDLGRPLLSTVATVTDPLAPGYTARVEVRLRNDGPGPVRVTGLARTAGAEAQVTGSVWGCDPRVVSLVEMRIPGPVLAPGESAAVVGAVQMAPDAADGCQGGTFSVPVTVIGQVE
jgi:hypothetical protein